MSLIRATIRFIAFFATTFALYGVWFLLDFVIPNKEFWRQFIFRTWAKSLIKVFGVKVYVKGRLPRPPFFLVSNHLSYVDIPLLRSVIESVFVAKDEIQNWFLGGKIVGDMGNIFVNRYNRRDIPRAGKEVLETLEHGEGVIVFPEGTTSNGKGIKSFKSPFFEFACEAKLPVHYAVIRYEVPKEFTPASESVAWWREESGFIEHLWELLKIPSFDAFITFGEHPIISDDRKDLAMKLHEAVLLEFEPLN